MAETLELPSGQVVTLQDVIQNEPGPEGMAIRFRFLAPGIGPGGAVDFDMASADMIYLCKTYAMPRLPTIGPKPEQVIISLSDQDVPFGEAAPDAVQYFEAYKIEDGECVWQMY